MGQWSESTRRALPACRSAHGVPGTLSAVSMTCSCAYAGMGMTTDNSATISPSAARAPRMRPNFFWAAARASRALDPPSSSLAEEERLRSSSSPRRAHDFPTLAATDGSYSDSSCSRDRQNLFRLNNSVSPLRGALRKRTGLLSPVIHQWLRVSPELGRGRVAVVLAAAGRADQCVGRQDQVGLVRHRCGCRTPRLDVHHHGHPARPDGPAHRCRSAGRGYGRLGDAQRVTGEAQAGEDNARA